MPKTAITQWDSTPANNTDIDGINIAENCPAAGINNAIRAVMAQVASWLATLHASMADVLSGNSAVKVITPDALSDSVAFQTLSIVSNEISPDMATGLNFTVTLTGNVTLNNIANPVEGYSGMIEFVQDATGGRTVSKPASGSKYRGPGGFPTIDTAANAITCFSYVVRSASVIHLFPARTMSAA